MNYIKSNFDGSVWGNNLTVGYIIRDYFRRVIAAGVINLRKILVL